MDFEDFIYNKVKSKKVLEIGGIGNYENYDSRNYNNWRHNIIKEIASKVVLGDVNIKGIEHVNKKGFNAIYFDVENDQYILNKKEEFDVILLLDVIEHLGNIKMSLENIKKYMTKDSELIISTPNLTCFNNIFRTLLGKRITTLSEHTVWIDEVNFYELARRSGFKISYINYFTFNPSERTTANIVKQGIIKNLGKINKYLHQNICVVFKVID